MAYSRMIEAHQDLQLYLNAAVQNTTEYRRLYTRVQVTTEEYHSLINRFLEDKYAEQIAQQEERSA